MVSLSIFTTFLEFSLEKSIFHFDFGSADGNPTPYRVGTIGKTSIFGLDSATN